MSVETATVYVVDDDASVRHSLARLIRSAGWGVKAFDSAREFIDRVSDSAAACMVLDVRMPGMSGPDLYGWLRERGLNLPVVFLTGHADVPIGIRAMKNGAMDFLLKPVNGEELLCAIEQAIQRHAVAQTQEQENQAIKARLTRLSPREREVMGYVIKGYLNKQIAAALGIAEKTVKVHRSRVKDKLEIHSVAELVHLVETAGVTSSPDFRGGASPLIPILPSTSFPK